MYVNHNRPLILDGIYLIFELDLIGDISLYAKR